MSFRGTLQGQPVVVSARLDSSVFARERYPTETLYERYDASGDSPYFGFSLQFKEVGGAIDGGEISQKLVVGTSNSLMPLKDDHVDMSMRLSAGGDSEDLHARAGELNLTLQTASEARGTFALSLGPDNEKLEGCFHFLATRSTTAEARVP
jgi:hypothetical protein